MSRRALLPGARVRISHYFFFSLIVLIVANSSAPAPALARSGAHAPWPFHPTAGIWPLVSTMGACRCAVCKEVVVKRESAVWRKARAGKRERNRTKSGKDNVVSRGRTMPRFFCLDFSHFQCRTLAWRVLPCMPDRLASRCVSVYDAATLQPLVTRDLNAYGKPNNKLAENWIEVRPLVRPGNEAHNSHPSMAIMVNRESSPTPTSQNFDIAVSIINGFNVFSVL